MFCIYLRTNSDLCHLQHKLIGFYSRDEKCLQRGTDWVPKQSSIPFVFKGLTHIALTEVGKRHHKRNVLLLIFLLYLRFRASLIYINNCPKRCNTKQSIYYSASSLYMFRVSTTPIIRSTQNCNYSLRYWS